MKLKINNEKSLETAINQAMQNDNEAMSFIIESIHDELYKIAILKLHNLSDAQDAVQEAELSICKNINQLKQKKYFKTWSVKILINECNKILCYKNKEIDNVRKLLNNYMGNEYESDIIDAEKRVYINELINKLDENDKMILKLYSDGYKIQEISDILNINENTIKTKLKRAKDKIRKTDERVGVNMSKLAKTALLTLFIIIFTTGLVYASIIIVNKIKGKAEPIKWDTINIEIDANDEVITDNMFKYDEEKYILLVDNNKKLNDINKELKISYIDTKNIDESNYDILFIIFNKEKKIAINNVLPYEEDTTIIFKEDELLDSKKAYCILIPKEYSNNISIEYTNKKTEQMKEKENAEVKFKFTPFYIENIVNFDKSKLLYNKENDFYTIELNNEDEYNNLINELGIVMDRNLNIDINSDKIILILKFNEYKINFKNFFIKDNVAQIYLTQTNEKYGKGITGAIFTVTKGNYEKFSINID